MPHRMHAVQRCGVLLQMQRGLSVCPSVSLSVRLCVYVSVGHDYKKPTEMPFGLQTVEGAQETMY